MPELNSSLPSPSAAVLAGTAQSLANWSRAMTQVSSGLVSCTLAQLELTSSLYEVAWQTAWQLQSAKPAALAEREAEILTGPRVGGETGL